MCLQRAFTSGSVGDGGLTQEMCFSESVTPTPIHDSRSRGNGRAEPHLTLSEPFR